MSADPVAVVCAPWNSFEMAVDWDLELKTALDALTGKIVTEVWVNEMALYGPEDAGHFSDPILNLVQANVLELRTSSGQIFHFSCVQTDDVWAIWPYLVSGDRQLTADPGEGTFRTRPMPEFPRGMVNRLRIEPEERMNIQEVRMTVDQRQVILRAGEIYENTDGTLSVVDRDESVLVFLNNETYLRLTFNEPIYRPFYI